MTSSVRDRLVASALAAVLLVGAALLVGVALLDSVAQGADVHADVFVAASGTSLVIGGYDDASTTATIPADQLQVFAGEVVPATGTAAPYESASPGEPGFRAATQSFLNNASLTTPAGVYTALPASSPLTFDFLPITIGSDTRNLFYWDGTGAVSFAPAASDVALVLTKQGGSGWTSGITGTSAGVIAGNTIQTTTGGGSPGTVHAHLFTSIGKAGAAPDQGFYLYSLQLGMTGFGASKPLYFVAGALDPSALTPEQLTAFDAAHGLAETWVQDNLVAVPEPSTLGVAGFAIGGIAGAARRWRTPAAAARS